MRKLFRTHQKEGVIPEQVVAEEPLEGAGKGLGGGVLLPCPGLAWAGE